MSQHYQLSQTKQQYREIFMQAQSAITFRLDELRKHYHCLQCDPPHLSHDVSLFEKFAPDCQYRQWQKAALETVEQEIGRDIAQQLQLVEGFRNTFSCHMCGMCCRMASSEYSYEELQARAAAGDDFAQQFTSVFLPYASREAAMQKYPEVVAAVLKEAEETDRQESIHFYHCPYIGEDNRCSIFGQDKRPGICASYPETPLSYVYEKCSWKPWKDETHSTTMLAHAMLALCESTREKLTQLLG
jgi:Fe-S-cluster containining protein